MGLPTCVATVPIFHGLSSEKQDAIARHIVHQNLQPGEILATPGTPGALRVVRSGTVRQSRIDENGSEQLLRLLKHGDFTGELSVLTGAPDEHHTVALTHAEVCTLSPTDLNKVLLNHPSVARRMLLDVSERLAATENQLAGITGKPVGARLAAYLSVLAEDHPIGADISLPMPKKDLASFLGTTPETISRRLRILEDKGIIQLGPSNIFRVLKPEELAQAE